MAADDQSASTHEQTDPKWMVWVRWVMMALWLGSIFGPWVVRWILLAFGFDPPPASQFLWVSMLCFGVLTVLLILGLFVDRWIEHRAREEDIRRRARRGPV